MIQMAHANKHILIRALLAVLPAQMLWTALLCCFPLIHLSDTEKSKRFFNVIVFENYLTSSVEDDREFDTYGWPTAEFPMVFSRLIGQSGPQDIHIPSGFPFPTNPMFIDINTFNLPEIRMSQKESYSRRNDIAKLDYDISLALRSKDRYEVELKGTYRDFKFRDILVEAPRDRTEIIRIRLSANRTLYVALTLIPFIDSNEDEIVIPKPISEPQPSYPSTLAPYKWAGWVRILCTISTEGKISPWDYVLMECPHIFFARISVDTVLDKWEYTPAADSGIPVEFRMVIKVPFSPFSPKMEFPLAIPESFP